jgi:hypothetical protein
MYSYVNSPVCFVNNIYVLFQVFTSYAEIGVTVLLCGCNGKLYELIIALTHMDARAYAHISYKLEDKY